jgi:hypothetical protein
VKIRDQYEELWADVIRRGVESGDFRIGDQKLFRLAAIQMVNGVAYWYQPTGETALTTIADEFAGFTLAMAGCQVPEELAGGRASEPSAPEA